MTKHTSSPDYELLKSARGIRSSTSQPVPWLKSTKKRKKVSLEEDEYGRKYLKDTYE